MKFFIDTANLEQIREAYALGVLDGVTTNPSLMAKEGIKGTENQRKHYVEICSIVGGDVSAEVIATDYEGMIREGEELAALNPHIEVKGLMMMAPNIEAEKTREYFKLTQDLFNQLKIKYPEYSLTELSMGMSNDYKIAIEYGATMVRIGSSLFK